MTTGRKVALGIGALWVCVVSAALAAQGLSASAGTVEGPWVGVGMAGGFALLAAVVYATMQLPQGIPLIVRRLVLLAGMAGAFWGMGTLTRALYALTL
ncbi:MAG: hypothetical protein R3F61_06930 [Myxococcota bacterium]